MEENAQDSGNSYTVVARRYRPKTFDELIGQGHIAQALGKAIETGRVGHAYLFTGARGVGKTSTARIFAKVLNTQKGTPDDLAEEIAAAIDAGEDMDTIEIDGASNRGIEEIRQLRANVNVRPSRARFKIYIIDEVHMLTNQAFNALLKTLEEPPAHVKFIFCTTDPDKIPITVLSRCQRFDFAPVKFEAIHKRLEEIAKAEGFTADSDAIGLLARRAAGSMRDSQSLLEQVMSFSSEHITLEQVNALLGTADEGRLIELVDALRASDALASLQVVEAAIQGGSDPGQLAEQLLNYLRDIMAVGVGGSPDILKIANPAGHENLKAVADSWGVQTVLSAIQILDESLVRMRASVSATTLLEVALVQICQLESLASIPAMLEAITAAGVGGRGPEKKNLTPSRTPPNTRASNASVPAEGQSEAASEHKRAAVSETPSPSSGDNGAVAAASPNASAPAPAPPPAPKQATLGAAVAGSSKATVTSSSSSAPAAPAIADALKTPAETHSAAPATSAAAQPESEGAQVGSAHNLELWKKAVGTIDGMLADFASMAVGVESAGSDSWRVVFAPGAHTTREYCEVGDRRQQLQAVVEKQLGRKLNLTFGVMPGEPPKPTPAVPQSTNRVQLMRQVSENPYVKKLCEAIGGEVVRVDPPRQPKPPAQ
ncbi:MAG: DNA polymerase III subunit gamma/tau [Aureliella sp.]